LIELFDDDVGDDDVVGVDPDARDPDPDARDTDSGLGPDLTLGAYAPTTQINKTAFNEYFICIIVYCLVM